MTNISLLRPLSFLLHTPNGSGKRRNFICFLILIGFAGRGYAQELPENATPADIVALKEEIAHRGRQEIEPSSIIEEKRWIYGLKTDVAERINALSSSKKAMDPEQYRIAVAEMIDKVINQDCNDGPRYRKENADIYNDYWNMTSELPYFEDEDIQAKQKRIDDKFQNLPYEEECQARIVLFRDSGIRHELDELVEAQKQELENRANDRAQKLDALIALRKEIDSYDKKLDELAQTADTKMSLQSNLYIMILVIGLLSIATIGIVRWFPPEVMKEWVESGQVIQFVTVMILLSVIMALGLAGLLTENTLGTLLGGIGGYVLSQGVGRSAARAAMKQMDASKKESAEQGQASENV